MSLAFYVRGAAEHIGVELLYNLPACVPQVVAHEPFALFFVLFQKSVDEHQVRLLGDFLDGRRLPGDIARKYAEILEVLVDADHDSVARGLNHGAV